MGPLFLMQGRLCDWFKEEKQHLMCHYNYKYGRCATWLARRTQADCPHPQARLTGKGGACHGRACRAAGGADGDHRGGGDRNRPRGMLRLNVLAAADSFLSGATLGRFLKRYLETCPELTGPQTSRGVRRRCAVFGGHRPDRITVPTSERLRLIVVVAPGYFARHPARAPARPSRA